MKKLGRVGSILGISRSLYVKQMFNANKITHYVNNYASSYTKQPEA